MMIVVTLVAVSAGYFLGRAINPANESVEVGPGFPAAGSSVAINADDLVGQKRPDFTLNDTGGDVVSASDFDGHLWLVNFWATWCKPCVEEMPMLSRLQQDFADKGVKVIGIALDDSVRASEFAAAMAIDYPILVGKADVVLTGRRFGNSTGALPFSVLVDADGIIRWTRLGALKRDELEEQLIKFN